MARIELRDRDGVIVLDGYVDEIQSLQLKTEKKGIAQYDPGADAVRYFDYHVCDGAGEEMVLVYVEREDA